MLLPWNPKAKKCAPDAEVVAHGAHDALHLVDVGVAQPLEPYEPVGCAPDAEVVAHGAHDALHLVDVGVAQPLEPYEPKGCAPDAEVVAHGASHDALHLVDVGVAQPDPELQLPRVAVRGARRAPVHARLVADDCVHQHLFWRAPGASSRCALVGGHSHKVRL